MNESINLHTFCALCYLLLDSPGIFAAGCTVFCIMQLFITFLIKELWFSTERGSAVLKL